MNGIIRPEILGLTPYKPGKPSAELEREMGLRGSVKLASNENCLGPSPLALEAARGALASSHLYPDGDHHELRARIAEFTGFAKPGTMMPSAKERRCTRPCAMRLGR